jgi:16S rRNA (guanine527-N7)-methyltransferase
VTLAAERRLAELAARYRLTATATQQLTRLLGLQAEDRTASTTVRDPDVAVDRHVSDSLVALELPAVRAARRIADIGSGAGWPGFAIAAALPEARVVLVESAARHYRYLERAAKHASFANVTVVHARAEAWPAGLGAHDLVTARALAALPVICEYAAPLLALGGELVAWKGAVSADEAADGAAAAGELGLEPLEVRPVTPYAGARNHTLHVFRKTAATPARFPRRPGIATKRPLSAKSSTRSRSNPAR